MIFRELFVAVIILVLGGMRMATAEVGEVRLATARGIGYLLLIVMEAPQAVRETRQGGRDW